MPGALPGLGWFAALAALLGACAASESSDDAFQGVLPLCNELFVAESKPRPPDADPDPHLEEVAQGIRERAAGFDTPAGVRYLRSLLDRESDEQTRACVHRLLADLREDDDAG